MQEGMQDFEMLSVATYHPCPPPRPAQRTEDELELIFEELLHIKAVAHLSNSVSAGCTLLPSCLQSIPSKPSYIPLPPLHASSCSPGPSQPPLGCHPACPLHAEGSCFLLQVKRELASVLMFESHQRAGTVCECPH